MGTGVGTRFAPANRVRPAAACQSWAKQFRQRGTIRCFFRSRLLSGFYLIHNGLAANVDPRTPAHLHLLRPPRRRRPVRSPAGRPANRRLRPLARPTAPSRRRHLGQTNRDRNRRPGCHRGSPLHRIVRIRHLPRRAAAIAQEGQARDSRESPAGLRRASFPRDPPVHRLQRSCGLRFLLPSAPGEHSGHQSVRDWITQADRAGP